MEPEKETAKEKEFFESIGRFVWHFSSMEYIVRNTYWMLGAISTTKARKELPSEFGFALTVIRKNINPAYDKHIELKNDILETLAKMMEMTDIRNRIIHSSWWKDERDLSKPFSGLRQSKKSSNTFGGDWERFTSKKIDEYTDKLRKLRLHYFLLIPKSVEVIRGIKISDMTWLK